MALRHYLCGSSGAVYHVHEPAPDDGETTRLLTPLHLPRVQPRGFGFRVVADLGAGRQALVCLGATRCEALELARARIREVPAGATWLRLQRWVGGPGAGWWQDLPCKKGELPCLPRPGRRPRARRAGLRRRSAP
jgi:hypothetical protein